MIEIIKNKSVFSDSDLIRVVRRENNAKRNYLLVNSMQGKHVPANPDNVLKLYNELAECLKSEGNIKKAVFIGFAETDLNGICKVNKLTNKFTECLVILRIEEYPTRYYNKDTLKERSQTKC